MAKKSTPIPGLTFSWKRALGITQAKQKISRKTGIPMTKQGIERGYHQDSLWEVDGGEGYCDAD